MSKNVFAIGFSFACTVRSMLAVQSFTPDRRPKAFPP